MSVVVVVVFLCWLMPEIEAKLALLSVSSLWCVPVPLVAQSLDSKDTTWTFQVYRRSSACRGRCFDLVVIADHTCMYGTAYEIMTVF